MPPRGRGGSRRGRGRGASATPAPDSAAPPSPPATSLQQLEIGAPDIPMVDVDAPGFVTPSHAQDDAGTSMDVDPNGSPATQPTETPAPTPIRPFLPPSANVVPAALPAGVKVKKESRFKPKAVRTSEAKRKEMEEAEAARQRELAMEREKASRSSGRGNSLRSRGRGNAMGRGKQISTAGATGIFGGTWASEGALRGGLQRPSLGLGGGGGSSRGGGGGGGGGSSNNDRGANGEARVNIGHSTANRSYTTHNGIHIPEPRYPGDDDRTARIDVEQINIDSEDEDDRRRATYGNPRDDGGRGMKPVRLQREEHVDRKAKVKVEVKDEEDELMAEAGIEADGEAGPDVVVDEMSSTHYPNVDVPVKLEPQDDMADGATHAHPHIKVDPDGAASMSSSVELVAPEATKPKIRKHLTAKKVQAIVHQTEEDKAEWARHLEDVEIMAEELGGLQAKNRDNVPVGEQAPNSRDGRAYVFQFPPVLPTLYNPFITDKPLPPSVATAQMTAEAEALRAAEEAELPKSKKAKGVIKKEESVVIPKVKEIKDTAIAQEEGRIGRLVVKKSGRVVMRWGGTKLAVSRGAPTSNLAIGVIVEHPEATREAKKAQQLRQQAEEAKQAIAEGRPVPKVRAPPKDPYNPARNAEMGETMSMGLIMGKFVVTPEWQ